MRFPHRFQRFLGAGTDPAKQLGQATDLDPNAAGAGSVPLRPSDAVDLVLISRFVNASGWPMQRVAIGYSYAGAGPAPALTNCALWIWDFRTERWYRMPVTFTLTVNQIAVSDVVALMEGAPRSAAEQLIPTAGTLEAWLAVPNPGGAPDGTYTFITGPDLSTSPP